jgi:predicted nucleic acid-binding protein
MKACLDSSVFLAALLREHPHGCDNLLTFNLRHFQALAPGDPIIVQP